MEAFKRGDDIHRFVASILFRKEQKDISELERQIAKGCVFGAIFGGGAKEMAIRLRIKEDDAQDYLNMFFKLFSGIKAYIERQHTIVMNNRVITTILGQPRKFILHQNNINDCKREGANHTIQAVGGGITFLAISNIYEKFKADGVQHDDLFLMHTIHDSTMADARVNSIKYAMDVVPAIMTSIPKKLGFTLDFPVSVSVGKRWGEKIWGTDCGKKLEEVISGCK
jgi:DNA polymerase-1